MIQLITLHSASWFPWLLDILLKSAVLLGLTGIAVLACWRASAAQRHLIWTLAVIGVLLLPVLSATLPAWHVLRWPQSAPTSQQMLIPAPVTALPMTAPVVVGEPTPPSRELLITPTPSTTGAVSSAMASTGTEGVQPNPSTPPAALTPSRPLVPWTVWAVLAWGTGTILVLAWMLYGYALAHRLRRRVYPAPATWGSEMPAGVRVLVSDVIAVPMVVGLLHPTILLPVQANDWPEERRRVVLLHELAHIQRGDLLAHLCAQLACACYWMNPMVWLAAHRMRVERETACDDVVLGTNVRASDYAAHLLAVASVLQGRLVPAVGIAMAHTSKVGKRVRMLLDSRRNRRKVTAWGMIVTAFLTLPLLVTIAVAQQPDVKPPILYSDPPVRITFEQKQITPSGHGTSLLYDSPYPVLSPDGSRVLFISDRGWEIDGKVVNGDEVFFYHRNTGQIENMNITGRSQGRFGIWLAPAHLNRVSWDGSLTADKTNPEAVISPDGRWKARFKPTIKTVGNPPTQIWTYPLTLVNRETGTEERIEVPDARGAGLGDVRPLSHLQFSRDGRYLIFSAQYSKDWEAPHGGGGGFSWSEVMVYDRIAKQLMFANVNDKGDRVSVPCSNPQISADGRYVLFQAFRHDGHSSSDPPAITEWREQQRLSNEDTALVGGYYLYDTQAKRVQRYRQRLDALTAAHTWFYPFTSQDGRYVVTETRDKSNKASAIQLLDTKTDETTQISDGGAHFAVQLGLPYLSHEYPSISADGRYISYVTHASNVNQSTEYRTPDDPKWKGIVHLAVAIQVYDREMQNTSTVLVATDLPHTQQPPGRQETADMIPSADTQVATEIAQRIVGIDRDNYGRITIGSEVLQPIDDVPFLRLSGKQVWRVKFHDIHLTVKGPQEGKVEYTKPWHQEQHGVAIENPHIKELDVLIDHRTRQVIKIETPLPPGIDSKDEFTIMDRQRWLQGMSYEYRGLLNKLPTISLMEALQATQEGAGGVKSALQIEAFYVLTYRPISRKSAPGYVSCRDDGPCGRWFIMLNYTNVQGVDGRWTHDPLGRPTNIRPRYAFGMDQINPETGEWIDATMKYRQ